MRSRGVPACTRRLSILFVGPLPPLPGGAAISAAQLLDGLTGRGHTVRALAPMALDGFGTSDLFASRHPAIGLTRFPVPFYELANFTPPSDDYRQLEGAEIKQRLSRLIADRRPDLILIGRESYAWYVPSLARRYGVPCVLLVRGNPTRAILDGTYPPAPTAHFLEQFGKVDLIITVARYLTEGLLRHGFPKVTTVLNAIDLDPFFPRSPDESLRRTLAIRSEDITVVHISNLVSVKRPLDIVSSAEHALKQNARLRYLIVGDGPLRSAMEEACRARRLADHFRFVGWIEYEHIPTYINLADIVVMPSEGEGLARVYLETQACGRVLLASDIPAAREVITDGETGFLFGKGDIADLTGKTLMAAAQPELRGAIGRKARDRVLVHALPAAVRTYAALLKDLVFL